MLSKLSIKIIVWHVGVALLAWWMWMAGAAEKFNEVTGLEFRAPSLGAFLLLIAMLVLGYILFQQRRWSLTTTAIIGTLFLFIFGWNWLNLVATGIFLLFNLWASNRVRREIIERKVLNISDAFYHGLTPVVLGLFVMISFAAYQSPFLADIKKANALPNQFQTFFEQIAGTTAGSQIPKSLPPQQRTQIINEVASQTLQQINGFMKPYFRYAPPVLAFGLFLILAGLSFLFVWMAMVVGIVMFWILKKTRMVRVEERDVKAEVLVV